MGSESEEDFKNIFGYLDLASSKIEKSENNKNEIIVKVRFHLEEIEIASCRKMTKGDAQ